MLIICEGPDCVGKSTLAVRFTKDLERRSNRGGVKLLHRGPPTRHPLDEYVVPLLGYRPFTGRHLICDRWHWGEAVYPQVFCRSTLLDDAVRYYIELFLLSRGAYVVHVSGPEDRTTRCIEHRGDPLVNVDSVKLMHSLFEDCERMSLNPFVRVDGYEVYDDALTYMNVIERAGTLGRHVTRLRDFTTYVGPPNPKLLLLGDVRGKTVPTCDDLRPAFMPYPSTSGHYLLTQLTRGLLIPQLREIGIANACDVDDARELWLNLGRPFTVALGRHAAKATAGWANHSVAHPQYIRRFHNGRGMAYVHDIIADSPISGVW